jgi:hypothetical protein
MWHHHELTYDRFEYVLLPFMPATFLYDDTSQTAKLESLILLGLKSNVLRQSDA